MSALSRRHLLELSPALAAMASIRPRNASVLGTPVKVAAKTRPAQAGSVATGKYTGVLCFFSKALPGMNWRTLAQTVRQIGFGGVDLTVRPEGHVLPERASEDLPRAVADIRGQGIDVPMITTALTSGADPTARPILSTAARLGIQRFKPGYYQYNLHGNVEVLRQLDDVTRQFRSLVEVARAAGIQAGYHNHEEYVGAAIWDAAHFIEPLDSQWVGYYFDPRHATAEGGVGAWKTATHLVLPRLKMIATKDFYWDKTAAGWRAVNCPLGQGMVDWNYFFNAVAQSGYSGPISLHIEYDVPGATAAARQENMIAAAARDFTFLRSQVEQAYRRAGNSAAQAT